MPIPADYFATTVDAEGIEEPSRAQTDVEALEDAVRNLRRLANALAERRVRFLDEGWKPAQIQRAKDRYTNLRQALIAAGQSLPTP